MFGTLCLLRPPKPCKGGSRTNLVRRVNKGLTKAGTYHQARFRKLATPLGYGFSSLNIAGIGAGTQNDSYHNIVIPTAITSTSSSVSKYPKFSVGSSPTARATTSTTSRAEAAAWATTAMERRKSGEGTPRQSTQQNSKLEVGCNREVHQEKGSPKVRMNFS
ncbi:hypothetical protein KC19_VG248200 [Ceratodon purpureus]|uniref:Uncharacterized protein n=1 Tax=Ceratodon purpureus TaxID=3225 RepID=A0A8T0HT94_CERPU|nr:hypothetical protein KC19_VG248200 [Ceratodon purpureus]